MIDTLVMGCLESAAGTEPRIFIELFGFGLNTCNQKHKVVPCKINARVEKQFNSSFLRRQESRCWFSGLPPARE